MRSTLVLLGAAAVLLGAGVLIVTGGNALRSPTEIEVPALPPDTVGAADGGIAAPKPITTERPAFKGGAERQSASRDVASEEPVVPSPDAGELERIEPRPALSEIGQALPPKPKMPDEWKGTTLFGPVATAAGQIEAKGYRIAIAGIEPLKPDETCDAGGRSWPCGMWARAAFRAWLRGRSVTCEIPPQPDRELIVVPCRVGKQDVGGWLVASGWARAAASAAYAAEESAAMQAGKGIFGQPPSTSAPAVSEGVSALPAPPVADGGILAAPQEEQFEPAPPSVLEGPLGVFPTPPAPPPAPAQ